MAIRRKRGKNPDRKEDVERVKGRIELLMFVLESMNIPLGNF